MTATNMCLNFGGFTCSPPVRALSTPAYAVTGS